MGLDMRPMGKPKPGQEARFKEIRAMIVNDALPDDPAACDALREEWFAMQIEPEETIKAPQVGKSKAADEWFENWYAQNDDPNKSPYEQLYEEYQGYYVTELAEERDGLPAYKSLMNTEDAFRGQVLELCEDLIGEDMVSEAWLDHDAEETLDYGRRLLAVADRIANENGLLYLKEQRDPPADAQEESLETRLHLVYSLARWLIFYGSHGHGYEADF